MFEKHDVGLNRLNSAARELLEVFPDSRIFAFYGEMGAGKTTFIQSICRELGSEDNITSPTFALINEYSTNKGETIYHFDFYRIKNMEEAYDMGYEDYFYSHHYCFIEWPEKIAPLLPPEIVEVRIKITTNNQRCITANLAN